MFVCVGFWSADTLWVDYGYYYLCSRGVRPSAFLYNLVLRPLCECFSLLSTHVTDSVIARFRSVTSPSHLPNIRTLWGDKVRIDIESKTTPRGVQPHTSLKCPDSTRNPSIRSTCLVSTCVYFQ